MNVHAPITGNLPPHVPSDRVLDYDVYAVRIENGDLTKSQMRYLQPDVPRVFWSQANEGHWVFTQSADIEHALSHPEIFSAKARVVPAYKNPNPPMVPIMMDPPDHGKYRALLSPIFTPKATQSLAERARKLAVELIADLKPRGECEFMTAFAKKLPIEVFMGMLDLPAEDKDGLLDIADNFVRPTKVEEYIASVKGFQAYAQKKIDERRANPGEDLISQLVQIKVDGKLLDDSLLIGMIVLLLAAGLDTVASQLGFFARHLAENPADRKRLRDQPDLVPNAVEELMRRYTIATLGRLLMQDYEIDGVTLKKGDMVIMPCGFVNMDASKFAQPEDVILDREKVFHSGFGLGVHRCIGSMLARAELRIFIEEWLKVIPDFRLYDANDVIVQSGTISGIRRLRLVWDV